MEMKNQCYNCGSKGMESFYEVKNVPVHSCLLMATRDVALNYPRGDVRLEFCPSCGFIQNGLFNPELHEYSSEYEETQGFSPTFNTFHRNLADRLIKKYDLYDKEIIEIGCGKGEFLTLLCELGGNRGVGFDPSYISARNESEAANRINFITDFYSEKYAKYSADFLCCKMTLEHIQPTAEFVGSIRRTIGQRLDTIVFFQIPDVLRILQEQAFWDIYYEHCSYFSQQSLARLFRNCGFEIMSLDKDFNDQYLMIEARPANGMGSQPGKGETDVQEVAKSVEVFKQLYPDKLNQWRSELTRIKEKEKRAVVWGSSSKGVAFLSTMGITDEIKYVVDINPFKHGKFLAGTGHEIVSPSFMKDYQPEVVVVMNPIYVDEIKQDLDRMGVCAQVMAV